MIEKPSHGNDFGLISMANIIKKTFFIGW